MLLSPEDADLFFRLHKAVMVFVNQRLHVAASDPRIERGHLAFPPEHRALIRDALFKELDLIDQFVKENPAGLDDEALSIAASWKHMVIDEFMTYRQFKKHMVFLTTSSPVIAYGVLGLTDLIEDMTGPCPTLVEAALLPFKGQIVHDGILRGYNITFGGGVRASLKESYRAAMKRQGIVTSLPIAKTAVSPRIRKPAAKRVKKTALHGRWRITEMEAWDQDFVNAEVEGYFHFASVGRGKFQFGYICGRMDCEFLEREGRPAVEWTWEGSDEMDPASGRGWAVLTEDGTLQGRIYFHRGDKSAFTAGR